MSNVPKSGDGLVAKPCPTLATPWNFPDEWVAISFSTGSSPLNPRIELWSSTLQAYSLLTESPRKPLHRSRKTNMLNPYVHITQIHQLSRFCHICIIFPFYFLFSPSFLKAQKINDNCHLLSIYSVSVTRLDVSYIR